MADDSPAVPKWMTFDEVRAHKLLGHSSTTLNRYIRAGIPLLGDTILAHDRELRKIDRGRWGHAVLRRLIVSGPQLLAERERAAELRAAKPTQGLLEDEACEAWGLSSKTLQKAVKAGKVTRFQEEYLRLNGSRGTRFRYSRVNGEALKSPPLKRLPARKIVDGVRCYSTADTAQRLGLHVNAVLAAAHLEEWHGVPFKPHVVTYGSKPNEAWYFAAKAVAQVQAKRKRAAAVGWGGSGSPPSETTKQRRTVANIECESVWHFAERNGLSAATVTGRWAKPSGCPHLAGGKVTIKRHRRKPYLPRMEVVEIEASLKARAAAGYKGVGGPKRKDALYATVKGEWCILGRHLAELLGMRWKAIRQWRDRRKTPGLSEPLRIHGKERAWSFVPVEQAKAIAAALSVAVSWREPAPAPLAGGSRANHGTVFSGRRPSNDVVDLAIALGSRGARSMKNVAREFFGGNGKKAESCLAQIRQLVKEGRIAIATGGARTT